MPNYNTALKVQLNPGESFLLFNAETPTPSQQSTAIAFGPSVGQNPPTYSVELIFSGAPGAFNFQIQEANTEAAANYITPSNTAYTISSASGSGTVYRSDIIQSAAPFVCGLLSSRTNSVSVTAKLTRLS